jgi:putative peptide zinc metalloprotease protein
VSEAFLSPSWHRVADLRPRLKPHGEISAHVYQGDTWYVLRDAASNRVHRFTAPAFAIVGALDGERTLDQIWMEAATRLGDAAPSQQETVRIIAQLHQQDMLAAGVPPAAAELLERLRKSRKQERAKRWRNPLAISLPLADPDRLLAAVARLFGAAPRWLVLALWAAVVLPAMAAAALHWGELWSNAVDQALSAQNLTLLALVFPVTKLFHELGHGLAAKSRGGAVNECGLMLLAFFPVPYVDASSAQSFPSRFDRILVGAAGMMAELFLAALALAVWLTAEDGLVKAVAFNVILIAGVSTLVVNGNPLMRFDAYFMLCDLLDTPNLGQRANRWWGRHAERLLMGKDVVRQEPETGRDRWLYALYAPASYVYRMTVLVALALFVAEQYLFAGAALAIWALVIGVLHPIGKMLKHLFEHPGFGEKRGRAVMLAGFGAAALGALLFVVPAPHHTLAEGVVWLPEDAQVRARGDGFVAAVRARAGDQVAAGQVIATLEDPFASTRIEVQRRKVAELDIRLQAERVRDQAAAALARRDLEAAQGELSELLRRQSLTELRAGSHGVLALPRAQDLVGRHLREGQAVGHVVRPDEPARLVRAVVMQDDIELVRARLDGIEASFADRPGETFSARLVREQPAGDTRLPSPALGAGGGGRVPLDPRDPEGQRALVRIFQFDLAVDAAPPDVGFGGRVHLRFRLTPEPVGAQIGRRVRQLFLARLNA